MSYLAVVNIIKDISEGLNPNGIFKSLRNWDASLEFGSANCQIFLFPMTCELDLKNSYIENWRCVLNLYFQDASDSTPEERDIIIASAGNLAQQILVALNSVPTIQLTQSRLRPFYRQLAGTYTGYEMNFSLTTYNNICATDTYLLNTDNMILTNTDNTPITNT
jgi:hypothetical protein